MSLAAIDAILDTAAEADEALRGVVRELAEQPGIVWAGIAFVEQGELVLGPSSGTPNESRRHVAAVTYEAAVVGELRVDGDADPAFLEEVACRISAHVLLGWDTGGETWEP